MDAMYRALKHQELGDRKSITKYIGLIPRAEDKIKYLSDSDRLSEFCELAGVDMDTLTDGESNRVPLKRLAKILRRLIHFIGFAFKLKPMGRLNSLPKDKTLRPMI